MNPEPAIEVNDVSKRFRINHKNKASYNTLKDDLANIIKRPLGLANIDDGPEEEFWALRDISFTVERGEVFGIIGRNGSGKSTLLKILSRIYQPTTGSAIIRGKVASLIEVGTGFHPELTGRENVYFNGSMLGMTRQEISKKFNEIVDFAEVEKFLDTPVKFYSSGMYVRLAFSVAAHLDPEILIIDEVLAVGDTAFQKKCMNRISTIAKSGITVLFVSHAMSSINTLCDRAMLLEKGKIKYIGESEFVTDKYLGTSLHLNAAASFEAKPEEEAKEGKPVKRKARLMKIEFQDMEGQKVEAIDSNQSWQLHAKFKVEEPCEETIVTVEVLANDDSVIYFTANSDYLKSMPTLEPGNYDVLIPFDRFHFLPGVYYVRIAIQTPSKVAHDKYDNLPLRVREKPIDIRSTYFKGKYMGNFSDKIEWKITRKDI